MNHFLKRIIIAQDGTGHAPLQGSAVIPQAKVDQLLRKLLPLLDDKDTNISLDCVLTVLNDTLHTGETLCLVTKHGVSIVIYNTGYESEPNVFYNILVPFLSDL